MKMQSRIVLNRFARVIRKFVRDERGDALQNVLLLAVSAVGIYVGFKYLWNTDSSGLIAVTIDKVNTSFQSSLLSIFGGGNN